MGPLVFDMNLPYTISWNHVPALLTLVESAKKPGYVLSVTPWQVPESRDGDGGTGRQITPAPDSASE